MAITTDTQTFHDSFRFLIKIDGVERGAFTTCSETSAETETILHYEGGTALPNKSPGKATFDPITLERGVVTGDEDMYNWWLETMNAAVGIPNARGAGRGVGAPGETFKRNVDIIQLDRDGSELRRIRLYRAYVQRISLGAWDGGADEKTVESVTLEYDYFEIVPRAA